MIVSIINTGGLLKTKLKKKENRSSGLMPQKLSLLTFPFVNINSWTRFPNFPLAKSLYLLEKSQQVLFVTLPPSETAKI